MKNEFKLDRSHGQVLSYEEADKQINDHTNMDWKDRFRLHQYLNSVAYGYVNQAPPRLDRTVFSARKQAEE